MGTCTGGNSKKQSRSVYKQQNYSCRFRGMAQKINFKLDISDLELHCGRKVRVVLAQEIGQVNFTVADCFSIVFKGDELAIHDTMIKCLKRKQASFTTLVSQLENLDFIVSVLDRRGSVVEQVSLKLHAVCEGPQHHDHLLKQMKARIIYNLEISQIVNSQFFSQHFSVQNQKNTNIEAEYGLKMELITPGEEPSTDEDFIFFYPKNPEEPQKLLKRNIAANLLKQSLLKITIIKIPLQITENDQVEEIHHFCISHLQFLNHQDIMVIETKRDQQQMQERRLKYNNHFSGINGQNIKLKIELVCITEKIYLEQLDCLIFSGKEFKTVPSHRSPVKHNNKRKQMLDGNSLKLFVDFFKKFEDVTFKTKNNLHKILNEAFQLFKEKEESCHLEELEVVQNSLVDILKNLARLITDGEDMTNQNIWILINKIIHRPELSTRYLRLVEESEKQEIGIKHFQFMISLLKKIICCIEVGLTYHELKCIQKFVAYAFFRYSWIRKMIVEALSREDDPIPTPEKLMEIGVFVGCRSPTKAIVFDWEDWMNPIKKCPQYKVLEAQLIQKSNENPEWAELIFNRNDDDLFFGLLTEIWSQGEKFLSNQGRIQWQYFPCYAQLLGSFLGQMNKNQIKEYSSQFRECSIKLISNEKLLNTFVALLFPKTCLYETYCVIKCLQLLNCYFDAISRQKKKIPPEFNFNYFYSGIRCIFESNHSYLLLRVIQLLYEYYHIFSEDFKKSLDIYVFDRSFYPIFLHWCGYVRRVFYLLLQFKMIPKFKQHCKEEESEDMTKSLSFQNISRIGQYKALIQRLQDVNQEIKNSKNCFSSHKIENQYFKKMKLKLVHQRKKKQKKIKSPMKKTQKISSHHDSPVLRKKMDPNLDSDKLARKWSYDPMDCIESEYLEDSLKKYIPSALKEHKEIQKLEHPDEEVKRIMKIFEKEKSVAES